MLGKLQLKFGAKPGAPPLVFIPSAITVFVGPNNSGKSAALRELEYYLVNGLVPDSFKILQNVDFRPLTMGEAEEELQWFKRRAPVTSETRPDQLHLWTYGQGTTAPESNWKTIVQNPNGNRQSFAGWYTRLRYSKLDGTGRLQLVDAQQSASLSQAPNTPLTAILRNNSKRAEWRATVHSAFKLYPALDTTTPSRVSVKFSKQEPSEDDERSFKECAVEYHNSSQPIEIFSDGVKAFSGMLLHLYAGDPRLVIIDEPEAFLHPALCLTLGREMAKFVSKANPQPGNEESGTQVPAKQLFVATHSAEFVMGCIQSKAPVNIIRLTYDGADGTARILPHERLQQLMRRPILRSVNAIQGLFYSSVIVAEADADRAFYQEVNERLLALKPEWGIPNCLFLNANGKDTIPDIVEPLRSIGIPTAAIADLDVLNQGGATWSKHLSACFVPDLDRCSFEVSRKAVHDALHVTNPKYKRDGGTSLLGEGPKQAADNLLSRLREYGLFVVPSGEVESWLPNLAVSRNKETWLREIFEKMGEDPKVPGYVMPTEEDVWKFMYGIKQWLELPSRQGVG